MDLMVFNLIIWLYVTLSLTDYMSHVYDLVNTSSHFCLKQPLWETMGAPLNIHETWGVSPWIPYFIYRIRNLDIRYYPSYQSSIHNYNFEASRPELVIRHVLWNIVLGGTICVKISSPSIIASSLTSDIDGSLAADIVCSCSYSQNEHTAACKFLQYL